VVRQRLDQPPILYNEYYLVRKLFFGLSEKIFLVSSGAGLRGFQKKSEKSLGGNVDSQHRQSAYIYSGAYQGPSLFRPPGVRCSLDGRSFPPNSPNHRSAWASRPTTYCPVLDSNTARAKVVMLLSCSGVDCHVFVMLVWGGLSCYKMQHFVIL
jgi:hypothetical protein